MREGEGKEIKRDGRWRWGDREGKRGRGGEKQREGEGKRLREGGTSPGTGEERPTTIGRWQSPDLSSDDRVAAAISISERERGKFLFFHFLFFFILVRHG